MVDRDAILGLMLRECDLCVHLHGKIPAGKMEFRFTPGQRSTTELLRYLSFIGLAATKCIAAGSWDPYQALAKEAGTLAPADFPAAMERQKKGLRGVFAELTEKDLATRTFEMPWKQVLPLGQGIVALAYAALVAYRMQLFLHAKAAGNAALTTANCWGGFDMPPKG
jgi:hypothetical protein